MIPLAYSYIVNDRSFLGHIGCGLAVVRECAQLYCQVTPASQPDLHWIDLCSSAGVSRHNWDHLNALHIAAVAESIASVPVFRIMS